MNAEALKDSGHPLNLLIFGALHGLLAYGFILSNSGLRRINPWMRCAALSPLAGPPCLGLGPSSGPWTSKLHL